MDATATVSSLGERGVEVLYGFDQQVYIDAKPLFYSFANETTDMTAAEVFAKYAAPAK